MINISVVIPMFNSADTIARALESVYCQNFDFDKVIVVDDCSTDNGVDIVMEKCNNAKYRNLYLFKTDVNMGPGGARNVGLSKVDSEYVAFLDADDVWLCNKTLNQVSILLNNKSIDIICAISSDFESFDLSQGSNNMGYRLVSWKVLLFKNYVGTRSVIGRVKFFKSFLGKRYTEDFFMWLDSSYKGARIAVMNNICCLSGRPEYSKGGYSGQLFKHEARELRALFLFLSIVSARHSGLVLLAIPFSIVKFIRRLVKRK